MLWKLAVACLTFLARPFYGPPVDEPPVDFHYEPTPYGPQNWREAYKAHEALYGQEGDDMRFPENWPESTGIKDETLRWYDFPGNCTIPYTIDAKLEKKIGKKIDDCIALFTKNTCVRIVKRTNEKDYVRIFEGVGCYSHVGRTGGAQPMSLQDGCWIIGTICHEFGHALGFFHEHQRSDRDKYIKVNLQNTWKNMTFNFKKTNHSQEFEDPLPDYDYDSLMHYGEYAFSSSPGVLKTMEDINKKHVLKEPYEKPGFTQKDYDQIKKLCKCKKP